MSVNKILSLGRKVPLDFNNIKEKDEYQVLMNELNYKKTKYKKLKFIMYTLSVILITVFSTLFVKNIWPVKSPGGNVNPGKLVSLYENGYFDKVICFGPEVFNKLYTVDIILSSNIISEDDKSILSAYCEEQKEIKPGFVTYFNIHFGIKDGKDQVLISALNDPGKNIGKAFNFDSNLEYSFESIISDLEIMTNTKFTDDFLAKSKYENYKQVMGIVLDFNLNDEGIYVPYYKVIIDDKVYVLNK